MPGVEIPTSALGASVKGDLQHHRPLLRDYLNARSKNEKHSGMTDSLSLLIVLFKSYRVVKNRQSNHLYAFEMYMLVTDLHKFY